MDDDTYVRALLAILTDPDPAGVDPADPYGSADDGIDRYDGFGREVVVTSLDVAAGEHGAELAVTYAVDLPSERSERPGPREGVVRVPFDSEWRELSGYDAPAAYAPQVSNRVMRAAHIEHHRGGEEWRERARTRASLPSRPEQRRILLEALANEGRVAEVAAGRYQLHLRDGEEEAEGGDVVVTVVVTPDQWEDLLATRIGDDADLYVAELLGPRDDDERFVVHYDGDLVRSTREALPPVRGRALERRMAELRASHPEGSIGWFSSVPFGPDRRGSAGRSD